MIEFQKPPPLKITCTATDCSNDLHCFKVHRKMATADHGKCRACGVDLVDWRRVHRRNIRDAAHTFEALKRELIRHHFFRKEIDEAAVAHARRKGRIALSEAARARLEKYLAPAEPPRDGRQDTVSGQRDLLCPTRDRMLLSHLPCLLARYSQRPSADQS